jgi:hypothetical protein
LKYRFKTTLDAQDAPIASMQVRMMRQRATAPNRALLMMRCTDWQIHRLDELH